LTYIERELKDKPSYYGFMKFKRHRFCTLWNILSKN